MDRICFVIGRLQLKRAVYDGVLTDEQIETESKNFKLNEGEKEKVRNFLKKDTYKPYVYEDEEVVDEEPVVIELSDRELSERSMRLVRKELFEETLMECNERIEKNEWLRNVYLIDRELFIDEIYQQKDEKNSMWTKLINASRTVMYKRARRIRNEKKGWVCGTALNRFFGHFEGDMILRISYDELETLVKDIEEKKTMTNEQENMIKVIVLKIPLPRVYRRSVDYLE